MPPTHEPGAHSIVEQLRRSLASLTPTEKKVARTLVAGYPAAGLGGVAELAQESKTSTASVIRLVQKLGYEGYASFHSALLLELSERQTGPVDRLSASRGVPGEGVLATLSYALGHAVTSIASTIPPSEFDEAVRLLSDPKRRILMVGGRISQAWAEIFVTLLSRMRSNVGVMSRDPGRRVASVLDLSPASLLVVFDFRRYDNDTVQIAREAAERRATVILVTDILLSPAASYANVVLPVPVEVPSPFDTSVTGLALVECLTWSLTLSIGGPGVTRMQKWDKLTADGLRTHRFEGV